jgi:hypothetical protein
MATVPRYFTPSTTGRGLDKRREHIMISGGREGPEIGMKEPRTSRYAASGSADWSNELESDSTRPEARTQPPFLRGIQKSERAYRRGTMTVGEMLDVGAEVLDMAKKDRGFVPRVEYTAITPGNSLAAVTGILIDNDVDTLSQQSVPNWDAALGQLAADLKAVELRVGLAPRGESRVDYMAPVRVYLGLSGSDRAVPISNMAVMSSSGGVARVGKASTVTGVYTPGESDGELRYKGEVLQAGSPISLASSLIEYVSVDPPKYRTVEYVNSPGFARSRGFVIELEPEMAARIGSPPLGRITVPYSTILRLRAIHPKAAGGWERKSSRPIEDTKTIQRELEGAARHLARIRDALVLRARGRMTRDEEKRDISYRDRVTGLTFGLEDVSVRGLSDPRVIWREVRLPPRVPGGVPMTYPPGGESALVGRRVTPVDLLRIIRAEAAAVGLGKLRSAEARRGDPLREYKSNPKSRR